MDTFIGQIMLFGFDYAPEGWAICDGQLLPITGNEPLYSLIGTTYGGDGTTTFGLPDLRGRIPVGQGQGAGLSNYAIGQMAGAEQVTLSQAQMPAHSHMLSAAATPGDWYGSPSDIVVFASTKGVNLYGQAGSAVSTLGPSIGPAGLGAPHENMMPTLVANYCIALQGMYPTQN